VNIAIELPDSPFLPVLTRIVTSEQLLSRDEAAELAGMDPRTFSRAFAKEFGEPFREIQREIKLQVAGCLLIHTSLAIADVGTRIGYSETRKFGAAFKKRFGVSPSGYRARRWGTPLRRTARTLMLLGPMSLKCRILLKQSSFVVKPEAA